MPDKVPPNLEEVLIHGEVQARREREENLLQLGDVSVVDDDGEPAPIQHAGEGQLVVVGEDHRDAAVMDGV